MARTPAVMRAFPAAEGSGAASGWGAVFHAEGGAWSAVAVAGSGTGGGRVGVGGGDLRTGGGTAGDVTSRSGARIVCSLGGSGICKRCWQRGHSILSPAFFSPHSSTARQRGH